MSLVIDDVLVRHGPFGDGVPVVLDSPHSGTHYPADFFHICPTALLRQAEDAYVDELFAAAPEHGATLICALFPRSYIDVNRAHDDIDPAILAGRWPGDLNPSEKSALGMGLIRILCRPGLPIYDGLLDVADVMERIDRYWRPYHEHLAAVLDALHGRFGRVWHINCHSMPSIAQAVSAIDGMRPGDAGRGDAGRGNADFVLGDRDGTTCAPEFTRLVADTLRRLGYTVRINDPYKGVELVRRYSDPARGRHSLQLEIDRRLYMNEETLEKHDGFERLRADLAHLVETVCRHAADTSVTWAAE